MKIAFLVAPAGVEQMELADPWRAVLDAGGVPRLVSTTSGQVRAFHHLDRADSFPVDTTVGEASVTDYDGLVLPGGVANPDALRTDVEAVRFVRAFFETGRPVAAICHAAWTLVEAGVLPGRTLTSWPSLATDIRNAGGNWVDEPVVVCRNGPNALITSRRPDDLKAFDSAFLAEFSTAGATTGG